MASTPSAPAIPPAGERVIRLPGGRRIHYDRLTAGQRATVDAQLKLLDEIKTRNPIMGFDWHSESQRVFLAALTSIIAAFAGNRFGKSTILVVKALIELLPAEDLPDHLRPFKRFPEPTNGWILVPTEDKLFDSIMPALAKWCGPHLFAGGAIGKAFHGERMQLTFDCGSTLAFKTYKQDPSTLGGADLHFAGYDEPPPQAHREEVMTRLLGDDRCFEMFAMTPLNTNTGWVKREIYKKRESPGITVVRGSMHDNPTLSKTRVAETLERYKNDLWRRAREFGDFIDVGGQIYEEFERRVIPSPDPATLRGQDIVVSIDNGIRNCAIVFGAFDNRGVCTIFDERLLQDAIPEQYVAAIKEVLNRWGLPWTGHNAPLYVIDPASAARNQVSGVSVQTALAILGIGCAKGHNDVEAGVQQIRSRLACLRLWIAEHCTGLRDEADEYAAEDREDGHFKPIKRNDHRCLVAGTMIATGQGPRPIERVAVGDRVWTRAGLRRVVAAALTDVAAPTLTLTTHDGRAITATVDHPVHVEGRGWVRLDAIRYGDILLGWDNESMSSCSTASSSAATPTPRPAPSGSTGHPDRPTASAGSAACTRRSGSPPMGRSARAGMSTTATTTPSTTTSPTSSSCPPRPTPTVTERRSAPKLDGATCATSSTPQAAAGTAPRRAASGTAAKPPPQASACPSTSPTPASTAAPSTSAARATDGSAPTTARAPLAVRPGSTTSSAPASSAPRRSTSTATPRPALARLRVVRVRPAPPSAVYNLTVSGEHEYFANGILVSNCDALRYLCMARPFYPEVESDAVKPKLAIVGVYVPPTGGLVLPTEPGHMGSMS